MKISRAREPYVHPSLGGVVLVYGKEVEGVAYIKFCEDTVTRVGRKLPRGVCGDDPAHLVVQYRHVEGDWAVYARYIEDGIGVLMKTYSEMPEWVQVKKVKHAKTTKNSKAGSYIPSSRTRTYSALCSC